MDRKGDETLTNRKLNGSPPVPVASGDTSSPPQEPVQRPDQSITDTAFRHSLVPEKSMVRPRPPFEAIAQSNSALLMESTAMSFGFLRPRFS